MSDGELQRRTECGKDKNVTITIADEALDLLVDKGFNRKMGARPLQRVIDKDIKRPLSRALLFGELKEGGALHISVDETDLKLDYKSKVVKVVKEK